jgi:methyl-accepting chemotaxis protein
MVSSFLVGGTGVAAPGAMADSSIAAGWIMRLTLLFVAAFIFIVPVSLAARESVTVDASFGKKTIGTYIDYIEDKEKKMSIEDAVASGEWKRSQTESLNFGFTESAYWFRFVIDNQTGAPLNHFFELTYPLMNYVDLYVPSGDGFTVTKTGNKYPFFNREIEDKNFIFHLKNGPGTHVFYLRIETASSMNFIPILMTQKSYFKSIQTQLPLVWIYYGLMLIMMFYNLFIFFASRDRSYLLYVFFIVSYILFQMTLNGYSFQYLWPDAIWWGCNALPFFMCMALFSAGVFIRDVIEARHLFRNVDRLFIFVILPTILSWAIASLLVKYSLAIRVATGLVGVMAMAQFFIIMYTLFKKSRASIFIALGFGGLVLGILAYVLKTFGVLPEMFITEWGVQIGSSLMVVFMSLALADKINVMRRELKTLLTEQQESERVAVDRAAYLEGVVQTATGLTDESIKASNSLQEITDRFSELSMEQASTSEQMSSTFEELSASVETIYQSTINQKDEGEKTKALVEELNVAQKGLIQESQKVEQNIRKILESTGSTADSLQKMTDTMNVINTGGKEITMFIGMIDDISDRINLLSLNAAIEAARAGEYGRGFAVVADEIGKLAQATSDNSKEISKQISKIILDIESGTNIVTGTKESTDAIFRMVNAIGAGVNSVRDLMVKQGGALDMVVRQAGIVDTMSKDIASSTKEQKNSMDQTQKTIDRLSEMAMEISQANHKIIDFTRTIHEKALALESVIRKPV